jgi:2-polyprenyl-3-methyl-5-hydroxy-6-metoxy-1,4-benzoquinol methylase
MTAPLLLVQKSAVRLCPISGDATVFVLHHQRFQLEEGSHLPSEYDVVWSPRAGFAYADTPAEQSIYDEYYASHSKYEDDASSTGGGGTPSDAERLARTAGEIVELIPNRHAKIVDIGCANGGLLLALKRLGCSSLVGVDPSPSCVRNVQDRHAIVAEVGSLFALPRASGSAKVALLSHVLEHICDLKRAVHVLADTLSPDGILYIEVPNAARYRDFMVAPFQDFNTEHINHFSLISLQNLFLSHAFEVVAAGTRTVNTAPGCTYPVLYTFFRRTSAKVSCFDFRTDEQFLISLQDYISLSNEKLELIESKLRPLSKSQSPLVVWGTGELTMKLLAESSLRNANILAFVDSNPVNQGKALIGRTIHAPRDLLGLANSYSILIATLLHQEAIIRTIRQELGLANQVVVLS